MRLERWKRRKAAFSLVGRCVGIRDGQGDVLPMTFKHPLESHLLWCRLHLLVIPALQFS